MKCLLVDDDKALLEQAEIFLEQEEDCFELDTVCRPAKALNLVDENDYDAIVSDYNMPEMNGDEFFKRIRNEKGMEIPFIFYTSEFREKTDIEKLDDNDKRYVRKEDFSEDKYRSLAETIVEIVESEDS